MSNASTRAELAVIGGTGFYALPGLTHIETLNIDTPFGSPSAPVFVGRLGDANKDVAFIARHGEHHSFLPSEINARANMFALKTLGVRRIIAVAAVGSLQDAIAPGHFTTPNQFIDQTRGRCDTFFGGGIVAHVSLADPTCLKLRQSLEMAAAEHINHPDTTYLCIEGPAFSTRAESMMWRQCHADVVGMTCLPEARLAREAEMCYSVLASVTDYDAWRPQFAPVTAAEVKMVQKDLSERATHIVRCALAAAAADLTVCACERSLDAALLTHPDHVSPTVRARLGPIMARVFR